MLDVVYPWGARVRGYRSRDVQTTVCHETWHHTAYWQLRHQVFVAEQQLFDEADRDAQDGVAYPIVALSTSFGMPDEVIGVVRIYPAEASGAAPGLSETAPAEPLPTGPGVWFGGRLGVCPDYRRHGVVGERLIKRAVGTARGLGCHRFLATVQQANVRYFQRHRFNVIRPLHVRGRPHALMEADVPSFDSMPLPAQGCGPRGMAA